MIAIRDFCNHFVFFSSKMLVSRPTREKAQPQPVVFIDIEMKDHSKEKQDEAVDEEWVIVSVQSK